MKIQLANPRGFCAGVDRAIEIVNRALEVFGAPVYVRHEVVHNRFVVDDLKNRGAVFVDELEEVPDDALVIFSAHGVSKKVQDEARDRGLKVFDATCPLVTKVHMEVSKFSRDGMECVLIGHEGHPEVEGTMGQYDASKGGAIYLVEDVSDVDGLEVEDPSQLAYVTQTTLSVDDTSKVIDALPLLEMHVIIMLRDPFTIRPVHVPVHIRVCLCPAGALSADVIQSVFESCLEADCKRTLATAACMGIFVVI